MASEVILVVDDNREIADFTAGTLLPSWGYSTLTAYDGRSGINIITRQPISLMILDLQLPDMTGLDLLRKISTEGYHIPTILCTAHGSEQVAIDAFRIGVQDYMIKPVDADELKAAVDRALVESRLRREKDILNAQLREQISMLTIQSRVGKSVTSTLELDEVLRRIIDACVHFTRADEGFLALIDENGQIALRAVKNIDEDKAKTLHIPVDDSLIGTVIRTGKSLRISDSGLSNPLKVSTGYFVHNLLHVPILFRNKVIGVLSVDNHTTNRPFKEVDEVMLASLADYAGVAIENARLFQQTQLELAERNKAEAALRESEERYSLAVRGANDGLWDWDIRKNRCYYSPRWISMLGYSAGEVTTSLDEWFGRIHPEDLEKVKLELTAHFRGDTQHYENEHRVMHKDGEYRWVLSRGIAVWDEKGAPVRLVGSFSDITDRKSAEEKLLHDAFHDGLTDLPNRTLFLDRLGLAVERAKRRDDYLYAVLYLDLDRFKVINDSLGHNAGDRMLIEISKSLAVGLRATDTVARLGGDEFAILLEDIIDINDPTRIANRIREKLAVPILIDDHEVFTTASIGIVISATGYSRPEDVMRDAEIAMYRAKQGGRARYEIFDQAMRDKIVDRIDLESDLRRGFERDELVLHYQPIYSTVSDQIVGLEALVRWQHPQRGLVPPGQFIPLAEETGLIVPIGWWVLRQACKTMVDWQVRFPSDPPLTLSVNLSGVQITQPDLVEKVAAILDETGLPPECLMLEITESLIMANTEETKDMLRRLHEMNVQIHVDDFGVGYSSLSYLSFFPIDTLKIDRAFIVALEKDSSNIKIIQAILMLARGLGMEVIAEGVETKVEFDLIKSIGCEMVQGYYLSRPSSTDVLEATLAQQYKKPIIESTGVES